MGATIGTNFRVTIFGQSHSQMIGAVVDGLPAGTAISQRAIEIDMERRAPGGTLCSQRHELDIVRVISGLKNDVTTGAPICGLIENTDARAQDYDNIKAARPGHADYTAYVKYGEYHDARGGGQFSGRMTAPLVFAGALARQLLEQKGVYVGGHICAVGDVRGDMLDFVSVDASLLQTLNKASFPVLDEQIGERFLRQIRQAQKAKDSVGGVIECAAVGVPAGWGMPFFDSLESVLAHLLFSVPAVKGVEFGAKDIFAMHGSEANDALYYDGAVRTRTNHNGGINGGISNGMPIIVRAAFKPTPSIGIEQDTIELASNKNTKITIGGRHDPCIVLRAVPIVEACMCLALADCMLEGGR